MVLGRRKFLGQAALATSLVALTTNAHADFELAGAETDGPTLPPAQQLALTTVINNNHGHDLKMTGLDVVRVLRKIHASGAPASFDIKGAASHTHTLTFTEEQLFTLLAEGQLNDVSSTTAAHSHGVTLTLVV